MTTLFDERERAAEYGFAHGEELRFLALRQGVETLAAWAANRMELHDEASYTRQILDAFLSGTGESALLDRVRGDLAHAGQSKAADQASGVLARATADATARLYGKARDASAGRPSARAAAKA